MANAEPASLYVDVKSEIEAAVIDQLRTLDQVSYVRFASVYREFKDVHDFVKELRPMLDESPRSAR